MNDSSLKSLKIVTDKKEKVELYPTFSPSVLKYNVTVSSKVQEIFIQGIPNEKGNFIQIVGASEENGLKLPINTTTKVSIKVDAQDKSSSVYSVEVFRPAESETKLRRLILNGEPVELNFQSGTTQLIPLGPNNHKATLEALTLDSEAFIYLSCVEEKKVPAEKRKKSSFELTRDLELGDSLIFANVFSANQYAEELFTFIIRRDPRGCEIQISDFSCASEILKTTCSFCSGSVVSPRLFARERCKESFCALCWNLVHRIRKGFNDIPEEKNTETETCFIFKCPLCMEPIQASDPNALLPDLNLQHLASKMVFSCPYKSQGCSAKIEGSQLNPHISVCDKAPVYCDQCHSWSKDQHKDCLKKCPQCDRQYELTEERFHQLNCLTKLEKPVGYGITKWTALSNWEKELLASFSNQKLIEEKDKKPIETLNSLWDHHLQQVSSIFKELSKPSATVSPTSMTIELAPLKDCTFYILSLLNKWAKSSETSKDETLSFSIHYYLGECIEEMGLCQDMFPSSQQEKKEDSDAYKAIDSGMDDEFNGLLESLGVNPAESDINKLKYIQEEYDRLLQLGLSNEAAEVQNLYQWKVHQLSKNSEKGGYNNNAKVNIQEKRSQALEKYRHALAINTTHPQTNFNIGRLLQHCEETLDEGIQYLRLAIAYNPLFDEAKFYLGLALIRKYVLSPKDIGVFQSGRSLLEKTHQNYFLFKAFSVRSATSIKNQMTSVRIQYLSFYNVDFIESLQVLAKAIAATEKDRALELLYFILHYLPETMKPFRPESGLFKRLQLILFESQFLYWTIYGKLLKPVKALEFDMTYERIYKLISLVKSSSNLESSEISQLCLDISYQLVVMKAQSIRSLACLGTSQLLMYDTIENEKSRNPFLSVAKETFTTCQELEKGQCELPSEELPPPIIQKQEWWGHIKDLEKVTEQISSGKEPPLKNKVPVTTTNVKKAKESVPPKPEPNKKPQVAPKKTPAKSDGAKHGEDEKKSHTQNKGPVKEKAASTQDSKQVGVSAKSKTKVPSKEGKESTATKIKEEIPKSNEKASEVATKEEKQELITPLVKYDIRIGLARVLSKELQLKSKEERQQSKEIVDQIGKLYKEAIQIQPKVYDSYIEFGNLLAESLSEANAAVEIYSSYPFPTDPQSTDTQDDLYLFTEIVSLLMRNKQYKDPRLIFAMSGLGRSNGVSFIKSYLDKLEEASEFETLKEVFAGAKRKKKDDPELVTYFKGKMWM